MADDFDQKLKEHGQAVLADSIIVNKVLKMIDLRKKAIQEIKNGTADFHLLEVMACPGGCINGGGQPASFNDSKIKEKRAAGLYKEDAELEFRRSNDNPDVQKLYKEFLQEPGSHKAHELLHTAYSDKFKGSYKDVK